MRVVARCLVLGAVLVAGCGDDDGPVSSSRTASPPATSTTAGAATVPTKTAEPAVDPLEGATDQPVTETATNTETALLTAVRAARHEGYDRVVFEFANAMPGYDVRYADGAVKAEGSGSDVEVDGDHAVIVRMENALDADLSKADAPLTYTGPRRFSPDTAVVSELVRAGGFEGVLTWAVGLDDRADYRVSALDGPPRLVVDFRDR